MPIPASASGEHVYSYQARHGQLRGVLGRYLRGAPGSSSGAGRSDWVGYGAGAVLDALLADHPVDRRGRCWLCRSRGWLRCRRPVCLIGMIRPLSRWEG